MPRRPSAKKIAAHYAEMARQLEESTKKRRDRIEAEAAKHPVHYHVNWTYDNFMPGGGTDEYNKTWVFFNRSAAEDKVRELPAVGKSSRTSGMGTVVVNTTKHVEIVEVINSNMASSTA